VIKARLNHLGELVLPNGRTFGHRKYRHYYTKKIILRGPTGPALISLLGKSK
jgi:hypothetical protein